MKYAVSFKIFQGIQNEEDDEDTKNRRYNFFHI